MSSERALKFACIWLLNPMVATISTRGSSEGLLGVMVMVMLWAVMRRHIKLAGTVLGLGVHFKIYPFIYAASIVWWLDDSRPRSLKQSSSWPKLTRKIVEFMNSDRIFLALTSFGVFFVLNLGMWLM
jgi:phosphatidylinositol glycan class M